jgi:threonine synthase
MAQTVYYFWSFLQLEHKNISFIVPSGNFGNIFSARVAQIMGLPIKTLNVVTNENDILHKIISSGQMNIKNVKETYSPSMDIQISSNFERQIFLSSNQDSQIVENIMNSFKNNKSFKFDKMTQENFQNIYNSNVVSNEETLEVIKIFKEKYDYLADPHTATGLNILRNIQEPDHPYVSLACAHPAKFSKAIEKAIGVSPIYPKELDNIFDKKEKMTILSNNCKAIKSHIIKNI